MKSTRDLIMEIELDKPKSDRGRQVLYLSKDLIKQVRETYPKIPISRLVERFLKEIVEKKAV